MLNFRGNIAVITLLAAAASAVPAISVPVESQLTSTEPMMKGHVVALFMSHVITSLGPVMNLDVPVLVSFNEAERCIELEILGTRDSIDGAKQSTDNFRQKVLIAALAAMNEHFNLTLEEKDLVITYINRNNWTKVLTLRNGSYALE